MHLYFSHLLMRVIVLERRHSLTAYILPFEQFYINSALFLEMAGKFFEGTPFAHGIIRSAVL